MDTENVIASCPKCGSVLTDNHICITHQPSILDSIVSINRDNTLLEANVSILNSQMDVLKARIRLYEDIIVKGWLSSSSKLPTDAEVLEWDKKQPKAYKHDWECKPGVWESDYFCKRCGKHHQERHDVCGDTEPPEFGCIE